MGWDMEEVVGAIIGLVVSHSHSRRIPCSEVALPRSPRWDSRHSVSLCTAVLAEAQTPVGSVSVTSLGPLQNRTKLPPKDWLVSSQRWHQVTQVSLEERERTLQLYHTAAT